MPRVISLYLPMFSTDRWRRANPAPAPPSQPPLEPTRTPTPAVSRKPDRHDAHYRNEPASPFALSKGCEMQRPGARWSGAEPSLPVHAARNRGPVWRPPKEISTAARTPQDARSDPSARRSRSPIARTPDRPAPLVDRLGYHPKSAASPGGAAALILAHRVGSRRLVYAACAAAQAGGVQPGLTVAQAQLVIHDLAVHPAEPEADAAALIQLARWAARHVSPIAAPDPPDGLFIDATGLAHLFGGEAKLLARLTAHLARRGFAARAAIADTPGAAWAWARFGEGGVLAQNAHAQALAPLPIQALRLDPDTADALQRTGFTRVADLMHAPRPALARRFGKALLTQLDRALGRASEPIDPVTPPRAMVARAALLEPLLTPEPLAEAIRDLARNLCLRLAAGGLGARRLMLVFTRVDGHAQRISAGTAAPSRDAGHLARLLLPRLETVDPGFGIERMTLTAMLVEPLAAKQLAANAGDATRTPDLTHLIDRLASRPETARLYRAAARESDMPERSVAHVSPLADAAAPWPDLPRPPRLLDPPEPIDHVTALLPDHPPVRFRWRGRLHQVARADGPERLHGEWWRSLAEQGQVRDYFQIETTQGLRAWLYRTGDGEHPHTGGMRWWLHGVFG